MGGIAAAIGGVGQAANQLGENTRQRRANLQLETVRLQHDDKTQLLNQLEAYAKRYPGTHMEPRFEQLAAEIAAQPVGKDLSGYHAKVGSIYQEAQQAYADKVAADQAKAVIDKHTRPTEMPRVGGVTPAAGGGFQTPAPFQNVIATPQPQAPPAAAPPLSPVQPQAQGGGSSSDAAFQRTSYTPATGAGASAPVQSTDVQSAGPGESGPAPSGGALDTTVPPVAAAPAVQPIQPVAPPMNFPQLPNLDLSDQVNAFNMYGQVNPVSSAFIPELAKLASLPAEKRLELELQLEGGRRKYAELAPDLKDAPDIFRTIAHAASLGVQIPGIASLAKPLNVPGLVQASALPPGAKDAYGNAIDPQLTPFVRVQRSLMGGPDLYYPEMGGVTHMVLPDPESPTGFSSVTLDHTNKEVGRTLGALPPPNLTSRDTVQHTPGLPDTSTHVQPTVPGVNAPPVGSQSPGRSSAPPALIPRGPGGGGGAALQPVRPPASSGGSTARGARVPSDAYPAAIKELAKKIESGDLPVPTDARTAGAAKEYMAEHHMEIPTPLSAKGQDNLQKVDSVLYEIDDVQKILGSLKGDPNLAIDYFKYKHNLGDSPYDELFTKISFEGLRSAAAALQGNGSRAYPVIKAAFQHIPNLDRAYGLNPDSITRMKDKLNAMQDVLQKTRKSVLLDERKSGVVSPIEPVSAGPKVQKWGRDAQGNPVPLP